MTVVRYTFDVCLRDGLNKDSYSMGTLIANSTSKPKRKEKPMRPIDACWVHADPILRHYNHAREKHPYFCDWIGPTNKSPCDVERVKKQLTISRRCIKRNMKLNRLGWDDLLDCEVWEVFDALVRGEKEHAVEKLYDSISVCLRAIDVIEGRQKLGKPKTIAEKYAEVRQRKESGKPQTISGNNAEK